MFAMDGCCLGLNGGWKRLFKHLWYILVTILVISKQFPKNCNAIKKRTFILGQTAKVFSEMRTFMPIAIYLASNFLLLVLWKNFLYQYEGFFLISPVSAGSYSSSHLHGKLVMLEISKHKNENSLQA